MRYDRIKRWQRCLKLCICKKKKQQQRQITDRYTSPSANSKSVRWFWMLWFLVSIWNRNRCNRLQNHKAQHGEPMCRWDDLWKCQCYSLCSLCLCLCLYHRQHTHTHTICNKLIAQKSMCNYCFHGTWANICVKCRHLCPSITSTFCWTIGK